MKVSIYPDDEGYENYKPGTRVFVDDVEVTNRCFRASEAECKAWCHKHNDKGRPFIDPADPTQSVKEVLVGKVRIVVPKDACSSGV